MKRAARLRKLLWIVPLVVLLLGGAVLVAAHFYLSSGRATRKVAAQLQEVLGGRVEVTGSDIGLVGDSTVQGVRAYEDGNDDRPWLQVDDVTADLSALSALRDKSPDNIRLSGARLYLRFDADGHLLTQLPKAKPGAPTRLPRLHIENGELTLDQAGHKPMIVRGLRADVVSGEGGVTLTGTVGDPFWGDWKAHGDFDTAAGKGSLLLDADDVDVTMDKLRAIAFIPPSVWDAVHVEGRTPAKVRLDMDPGGKTAVHYRVEVAPPDAHVQVPPIDLDAVHASGKAVVEDEVVTLEDVKGQTAGGAISTGGKLNFHDTPTKLDLKIGVQEVVVHDLPASWKQKIKILRDFDGRLTGKADLLLTIRQGNVEWGGSGRGKVAQASFRGIRSKYPIPVSWHFGKGAPLPPPKTSGVAEGGAADARAQADTVVTSRYAAPQEREQAATDPLDNAPAEAINMLGRGIKLTADGLTRGIDAASKALGKFKPPTQPNEQPNYFDVDLSLQDVDLAQVVQKLKLNVPYEITGRLSFDVHASIPVNTAGDFKAYRLRGTAKLPRFNVAGLEMANVRAKVRYANGLLDLQELRGEVVPPKDAKEAGTFYGNAQVEVVPQGDLRALLKLDRIPLSTVLSLVPQAKGRVTGVLSGTVLARAPVAKLGDPASWNGSADVSSPAVEVFGLAVRNLSAGLRVDEARARLTSFKADLEGTPLTGDGELRLRDNYPFKAEVRLGRTDLVALNRLAPSLRPPVAVRGRAEVSGGVSGTLKPLTFDTTGRVEAHDLVAEGFKVDDLSFRWSKDRNGLKLDAVKAALYGGEVNGSAVVPLAADATGTARLRLRDLDVQALARSLPSFPVRLEGKVSGTVRAELDPAAADRPRTWSTDLDLAAPKLRVQGIPTEKLKGTVDSRGGKTSYRLQGESLGGTFTIKGDLPARPKEEEKDNKDGSAGRGRLEVRGARLSRLWAAYGITGGLSRLDGTFSLVLPYTHTAASFFPAGSGTFRIVNITWNDEPISNGLQGDVILTANELRLVNVSGDAGGGTFLGRFVFGLKPNSRSWFDVELQQVEASRLLAPLPDVAAHVKGPVDANLRGRIGPEWDGGGGATLVRGQVYGMEVTEWRIPLTFRFSPTQGNGELTVRDSAARIAQGRARFEASLYWGNALRLTGRLLFYQVDLRTLLRHSPELAAYASGRVSGRVDLGGSEMRSANDLTAVVHAKLEQGQALQLPVLRQITPYLRPGVSSATFQSGELKGRLANGIFRVQYLTLVGDFLKLFVTGTVNLAGNLNLDVTAQTGLFCLNPARQNAVSSRIPLIGAIPRLVLYEATSLVANQVVHLRVTGNVRSPIVRLEPLLLLTEDAVRFFLGRALGLGIPGLP